MSIREIIIHPDPRLREQTSAVDAFTPELEKLIADMIETMYQAQGIGLAAPQIGEQKRLFVLDVSENHDQPQVYVNPEIVAKAGEVQSEEGCLSIPSVTETVPRAETISVRALDQQGAPFEQQLTGLHAICVQHELDHLDGKLFIDYLSPLKQKRIRKKLLKQKRLATQNVEQA